MGGRELVRDLPAIEPSPDFHERLQHRIFHVQDAEALAPREAAGIGVTVSVAAAIALLAWMPMLVVDDPVARPAARAVAPPDMSYARLGVFEPAFRTGQAWLPVVPAAVIDAPLSVLPGPYSPLVVEPPVHTAPAAAFAADVTEAPH